MRHDLTIATNQFLTYFYPHNNNPPKKKPFQFFIHKRCIESFYEFLYSALPLEICMKNTHIKKRSASRVRSSTVNRLLMADHCLLRPYPAQGLAEKPKKPSSTSSMGLLALAFHAERWPKSQKATSEALSRSMGGLQSRVWTFSKRNKIVPKRESVRTSSGGALSPSALSDLT